MDQPAPYPPHILVVDDDTRIRTLLKKFLGDRGYMVTTAADAAEARRQLASLQFDLLVVDVMMPGEDGMSLTKSIRASNTVPILMLTAMGEAGDRIRGLEFGVDDYMAKPFEPKELVLRIGSILRRAPPVDTPGKMELRFGDCRYDLARQQLTRKGKAVRLTAAEAELLKILTQRAGEPVDRSALGVSGNETANPRTIDVQITRLRRKIEPDPRQPRYLQTVRGTGYVLRAGPLIMDKPLHAATDAAPATGWLKWLEPAAWDRIMPRTLMARATMTIVVPIILVQVISTYVFYDNHWDLMSRRMTANLAGDIAAVQGFMEEYADGDQRTWMIGNAKRTMELDITVQEDATLAGPGIISATPDPGDHLESALWQALQRPFTVDFFEFRTDRQVAIRVQMKNGVLTAVVPRRRILNNTTYVFVLWMTGSSMLLFGVATAYLRAQVRAVRRLAQAADSFGKGREVPDFPAEGAFEVRQAGRAFNIMRDRIQRQITQRTDMLSGVSHDLRTPLTRMKLQLAMMDKATVDDIAALRDDLSEMERMLEAYLAFARGDGAEDAAPTDITALLESVTGRFRRAGRNISLNATDLPTRMALKPIAFERCLGNLVGNAVSYGKNVVVTAARAGRQIHIHVDDDGPGIPADKREEVFRAFHRLEPSRNPATGGVGLGLTIARDIVRGMGGEIALDRSPAGGLRASLTIPL